MRAVSCLWLCLLRLSGCSYAPEDCIAAEGRRCVCPRLFLVYLEDRHYKCRGCGCPLAQASSLISKVCDPRSAYPADLERTQLLHAFPCCLMGALSLTAPALSQQTTSASAHIKQGLGRQAIGPQSISVCSRFTRAMAGRTCSMLWSTPGRASRRSAP